MNGRPRLLLFLTFSLLAHGAVAFAWRAPAPSSHAGTTLQVSLLPLHLREVRQQQAAAHRDSGPRPHDSRRVSASDAIHAHSETTAQGTTGSRHGRTGSTAAPAVRVQVAARAQGRQTEQRIARSLARYFYYPPVAIRYAWQGTVRIGLRVDRSGKISHIHLVHSSGYAVLDNAALRSTRQIKTVGRIAIPRSWGHFDLQLPVVYRLAES